MCNLVAILSFIIINIRGERGEGGNNEVFMLEIILKMMQIFLQNDVSDIR